MRADHVLVQLWAVEVTGPYYSDNFVSIYHGDCLELADVWAGGDVVVTDPPYGETSLDWDKWPDGWPAVAALVAPQMWCFGSMRMFLDKRGDLGDWKLAQDVVWEKHNGSSFHDDRFRRVHEFALHFYRGDWEPLFKEPQFTNDATARTVRRKARPPQWGDIGASSYASDDGGPRRQPELSEVTEYHPEYEPASNDLALLDDDDLALPLPGQLDPAMQRTARLASLDPNDGIDL